MLRRLLHSRVTHPFLNVFISVTKKIRFNLNEGKKSVKIDYIFQPFEKKKKKKNYAEYLMMTRGKFLVYTRTFFSRVRVSLEIKQSII